MAHLVQQLVGRNGDQTVIVIFAENLDVQMGATELWVVTRSIPLRTRFIHQRELRE